MKKLALIGVGMIGGSWALALKKADAFQQVIGIDNNQSALDKALNKGVIDSYSVLEELPVVDAIIIATPVGVMHSIFNQLKQLPYINDVIITDVGSTKQSVIRACLDGMGFLPSKFIPSHPIAGKEFIGIDYATENMFKGYKAIITPHDNCCEQSIKTVANWWELSGAIVDKLSPQEHDKILAITSHVPHVLAYGLMETIRSTEYKIPVLDYAAGGFKSFSRTASSNPVMWKDICFKNKANILFWLDNYQQSIEQIKQLIVDSNEPELLDVFVKAKKERDESLLNKK